MPAVGLEFVAKRDGSGMADAMQQHISRFPRGADLEYCRGQPNMRSPASM
jgi:hypothetical protein